MNTDLVASKKARQCWIGSIAIILATLILNWAGVPENVVTTAVSAIAGIFASYIMAQGYSEKKTQNKGEN